MSEAVYVSDSAEGVADTGSDNVAGTLDFEQFVVTRTPDLWRSAYLLTGDAHKAEDLLQTALVKAWRKWPSIARDGAVEAYVRRALVTTYTDWWRRKWNGELPTGDLPEHVSRSGRSESDLADVRRDVLLALNELTRGQRAVIVLRYFDDLTEQQAAAALGCSTGTIKSQAARAMKTLRSSPKLAASWDDGEQPQPGGAS